MGAMRIHDINSVLAAQLGKTSARRVFEYSKLFEHRLENLTAYLAEALDDPDFTILDATGRPRIGTRIRRLLTFALAFGDGQAAGQWAQVATAVYPAFSLGSGNSLKGENGLAVGSRLREMKNQGLTPEYARLVLTVGGRSSGLVIEAWRAGVPAEYLSSVTESLGSTEDAILLATRAWADGLPLEYALAVA